MVDRFLPSDINISLKDLVRHYYSIKPKLKYKEICSVISTHSNRRLTGDQLHDVTVNGLDSSLQTVGYRQITEIACIKYNINVSKEDVRKAVKIVNPEGVQERR